MTSLEQIKLELNEAGYKASIVKFRNFNVHRCLATTFDFRIDSGRYRGRKYKLGISFQENGYPEYPPHFVHILNAPQINFTVHSTHDEDDGTWYTFSLPPIDIWDNLASENKNMHTYVRTHLRKFWDQA